MKRKQNRIIAAVFSVTVFILGYTVCALFFRKHPTFSYTAEWTTRHYYCFIWIASILFAAFGMLCTSVAMAFGCFISIALGDIVGQRIIDSKLTTISQLIIDGVDVSLETISHAYYHYGVFIWLIAVLFFIILGITIDILLKFKIILI